MVDLASKIKKEVDIFSYLDVNFTGEKKQKYFNPCPFCDHNNCFSVSHEDKYLFSCFSCHAAGSVIDLCKHKHQIGNGAAIQKLGEEYKLAEKKKTSNNTAFWIYNQHSTALTPGQATTYLNGRGIGAAGIKSMEVAGLRWNQYKDKQSILAPVICPSILANGDNLTQTTFCTFQRLPVGGRGQKWNRKGDKVKGNILPILHDNNKLIILVESVANALCLHTAGFSAICLYSSTFVDAVIPELQKHMPNCKMLLWLDKGTEDKQIKACTKYKLPGMWFGKDDSYGYDINDLYVDAKGAEDLTLFQEQVNQAISVASDKCPYTIPEKEETVREEENPDPLDNRLRIPLAGGGLHLTLDAIEDHITNPAYIRKVSNGAGLFQRFGAICRIIAREESVQGLVRSDESLTLVNIDSNFLTEYLSRIFNFEKWNNRARCFFSVDCPKAIAEHYMSRNCWRLPHLAGIIEAPTILPNGQILQTQGYNKTSGLFVHLSKDFEPMNAEPTHQDAINAINLFKELFKDFPFEEGVESPSFSVVVAAIITGLVRRSIRTAPLFCFTAPKMGSGKTLLADLIALIATGRLATKETQAKDPNEQDKRMLATLLKGDQVICIDNIERPLESDAFCTVLTETTWQSRILGETKQVQVDTCVTWLATGNNLRLKGDLSTRAVLCSLDPKCENPHERQFEDDIRARVLTNRIQYTTAALTILRAYFVAGKPKQDIKQFGRFEEWSETIRSALVWAGAKDPNESIKIIMESDPTRETLTNLLSSWYECFQNQPVTIRHIKHYLADNEYSSDDKIESLKEAICALSQGGRLDFNRLGYYLRKRKDRIESGYQLVSGKKNEKGLLWKVIRPLKISITKIQQAKNLLMKGKTEKEVMIILKIEDKYQEAFCKELFAS